MNNSTTDTYIAKREILAYADKLSSGIGRPGRKFISDMVYGLTVSGSVILSNIADALKEDISKDNTVERLSRHLAEGLPKGVRSNYLNTIKKSIPKDPIILLDDTDVIKPLGKAFEGLGRIRDGSSKGKAIEKGYLVTEAVALSKENQPISLYSEVYSQYEKGFKSVNTHTLNAISRAAKLVSGTATFVCDRGYDANGIFEYLHAEKQHFIIRLTKKRNLYFKGKWHKATTLMDERKGKYKTTLKFQDEEKECYVGFINVKITASERPLRLVFVYGLGEEPMMLATNKPIKCKDDVVKICRTYLCRWRIEEYFRFKKQHFDFEGFRIRKLKAINSLNTLLSFSISFLNCVMEKSPSHRLKVSVYERAKSIKEKVLFYYYRIAKGLAAVLANARTGIRDWYKPLRIRDPQICFRLNC
jgi:hypothetical protein